MKIKIFFALAVTLTLGCSPIKLPPIYSGPHCKYTYGIYADPCGTASFIKAVCDDGRRWKKIRACNPDTGITTEKYEYNEPAKRES